MKYDSVLGAVGGTPIVELARYGRENGLSARIYAKLEMRNPGGSVKDRIALNMVREAEAAGKLRPGGTIIESTSGNTGIGLAMVGAVLGYRVVLTMPESMSVERRKLLAAYGAEIVLTDSALGMAGANARAKELYEKTGNSILASQFSNPANPNVHAETTGPEIYVDMAGALDAFVATVGTGGTLTGTGSFLKKKLPHLKIYAVEPAESPLLSGGGAGAHGIQGIGANFIPDVLDRKLYDEVLTVSTNLAMETARELARVEGILCGISSGAAVAACARLAKLPQWADRTIVTVLPDTGERYLSTELFGQAR